MCLYRRWVASWWNSRQNLDTSILDEQVIAVPKIFLDRIPQRSASRRTQKAEQLVEVPTEPIYALAVVALEVFFEA